MRKFLSITFGLALAGFLPSKLSAQLVVNGGSITIGANAFITVQGDFTTNTDILGAGKIIMNGSSAQQLNLNGKTVPNLEINSTAGVVLAGDSRIGDTLNFVNGKLQAANFNLTLGTATTVTGTEVGKFVETNGTGQVRREVAAAGNFDLPVGSGSNYMPLQYQVSGGTIAAGAYVATSLVGAIHPKKPIRATDNLTSYWKSSYSGISGGTVNAIATYVEGAGINGDETLLNGIRHDGTDWSLANSSINTSVNSVTFNNVGATGIDLYAMNKFLLTNAKAFLQGAYNSSTGKMSDALRVPTNVIPTNDPYRTAPYSTVFTHTNNPTPETVDASVFTTQTNEDNNIVDWVFLELRNTSNALVQTRSALLQRDGDIVEVDGVNPVFFKNLDAGNFIVTVRHRNHLGLGVDATTYAKTLSVANPTAASTFDLRTASDAQLFGTSAAFTTASHPSLTTVSLLWGGDVSGNGRVRFTGNNGPTAPNDRIVLLQDLSNNEASVISNSYQRGDVNFNRITRYQGNNGPGNANANDRLWILAQVLNNSESNVISQQIPLP